MLPLQIISSGLRSERIVAKRSQNNVVIGRGSTIDACEHFAFDVFVLGADGHAAVIALVDVLPKAHRHVRQAPVVRDTPPANENGVAIVQPALLNPGIPRPNRVVPVLKKFALTSSRPAAAVGVYERMITAATMWVRTSRTSWGSTRSR